MPPLFVLFVLFSSLFWLMAFLTIETIIASDGLRLFNGDCYECSESGSRCEDKEAYWPVVCCQYGCG